MLWFCSQLEESVGIGVSDITIVLPDYARGFSFVRVSNSGELLMRLYAVVGSVRIGLNSNKFSNEGVSCEMEKKPTCRMPKELEIRKEHCKCISAR